MKNIYLLLFTFLITFSVSSQDFITRDGTKLMYMGEEILLRGMAFGNLVWDDRYNPDQHHTEKDLERISALGMNAIRFYLNYKTFEDDSSPYTYKESGWEWIDNNIEWARKNGVFLILNMHVPQGGFQSQCNGDELWTVPENQSRLAALWKAIAAKYKDEPQIAGFDIVNEPIPVTSVNQWTILAQRIIDSIRTVDQNHLIITERAIALDCNYGYADENNNYPQITEENLMYTVHLYEPYSYTHQLMDWAGTGDGGKYPDENLVTAPSDAAYATGDYNNRSINTGNTDWTYYEGSPFKVNTDTLAIGRVVFTSRGIGLGKVYFDDIELKELDENGDLVRVIYADQLISGNYWWWSQNEDGGFTESTDGHEDNSSIMVTGNIGPATVICADLSFSVKKGYSYQVSGWMKGEGTPSIATANITTEYYYSPSGAKPKARNYEFMKEAIVNSAKYVVEQGYPVYFGEFGTGRSTFENDKGGERWVRDALKVFDSLGYHFTYHSYKESSFGYYDGWDQPVDTNTVNKKLKQVFEEFFGITSPTGLNHSQKNEIKIYPNPVNDQLYISVITNWQPDQYEILNMSGKPLLRSSLTPIDTSTLLKGVYLIRLTGKDETVVKKFYKN